MAAFLGKGEEGVVKIANLFFEKFSSNVYQTFKIYNII